MIEVGKSQILLSFDEVIFLLRAMGAPNLPGMENSPWEELTDPMADVLIAVAGRALQSRLLAGLNATGSLVIDPTLQAMLEACVWPSQMLILTSQSELTGQAKSWYYGVDEFCVHQTLIAPWIYQFDLSTKMAWDWEHIDRLLQECPKNGNFEVNTVLDDEQFEKIRLASLDSPKNGQELLEKRSFSTDEAHELSHALHSALIRCMLQYTFSVTPQLEQETYLLLANAKTTWLLHPNSVSKNVAISCLPIERIRDILQGVHGKLNGNKQA